MKSRWIRWACGASLAALFAIAASLSIGKTSGSILAISAGVAWATTFGIFYTLDRVLDGLITRMETGTQRRLDVYLNGIKIGTVTDAYYASLQATVLMQPRYAVAQAINVASGVVKGACALLVAVPFVVFWVGAATLMSAPDSTKELIDWVRTADPVAIAIGTSAILRWSMVFAIVGMAIMIACGRNPFRFQNVYGVAVYQQLRHHFGVAAEGDLDLVDEASGGPLIGDLPSAG